MMIRVSDGDADGDCHAIDTGVEENEEILGMYHSTVESEDAHEHCAAVAMPPFGVSPQITPAAKTPDWVAAPLTA